MHKRSFISFSFLFIFWMVISEAIDLQHIIVGIIVSLLTVWFWQSLEGRLPSILYPRELFYLGRCIIMLIGNIIQSNIDVIKVVLFSDLPVTSMFLELTPGIKSDWGRVFLATCITITPGTVTVDFDPEDDIFTVHALTQETGIALYYWRIITEIRNLERMVERRKAHAVNNDRIHSSNSGSSSKSDNRTHGD